MTCSKKNLAPVCNSKWLKNTTIQSVIRLLVFLECIQQDKWVIRVAILQWIFSNASFACLRNQNVTKGHEYSPDVVGLTSCGDRGRRRRVTK